MQAVDAIGVVVLLCAAVLLLIVLRRRRLESTRGAVEAALRRRPHSGGGGWSLGVLRFVGDRLEWSRVLSLSPRPAVVLSRSDLLILGRRMARPAEHMAVTVGGVVLELSVSGVPLELAMTTPAASGLLAWLEAAPPGTPSALAG